MVIRTTILQIKMLTAPRNQNIINAVKPADISFNPFAKVAPVEEQIGYSNDGEVKWFGLFSQFEYSDDHFQHLYKVLLQYNLTNVWITL